jgi:hypothetical protein
MTYASLKSLLRRTAAIGVIVAPFLFSAPASALTVILNNATGNSCTYTGMTVDPAGNVAVTCQASGGTPGPGVFTLSAGTSMAAPTAQATSTWSVTVVRSGGTAGVATVSYAFAGTACTSSSGTLDTQFPDTGTTGSQSTSVSATITGAGSCTITLSGATTATISGAGTATVTVTAGGGTGSNGVPIVAGCPAPDPTTTMATLPPYNGTPIYLLKHSGEVTSFPLPRLPAGKNMEQVAFGETPITFTPSPFMGTVSITPCPGVFNPKLVYTDRCNGTFSQTNGATFYWAEQAAYAKAYTACLADPSTQYYFNVKWEYTSCAKGAATCGFSVNTGGS